MCCLVFVVVCCFCVARSLLAVCRWLFVVVWCVMVVVVRFWCWQLNVFVVVC